MGTEHTPVLLDEVLTYLNPQPNQNFIDATFGGGGHTAAILKATAPKGQLFTFDIDPEASGSAARLGSRVHHFSKNFSLLYETLRDGYPNVPIQGVLFDLGYSSLQLVDPTLGLSFQTSQPLDMRLSRTGNMSAAVIVNSWSEKDIADVIFKFGEERLSRRIASAIVRARKEAAITTTDRLVDIVRRAVGGRRGRIHPATKTFQALRIAVNGELDNVLAGVAAAKEVVTCGGRIAVITFHSLEDRVVKQLFREAQEYCHCEPDALQCHCAKDRPWTVLTKKPVVPSRQEILQNPRARSAKLRVIEKIYDAKTKESA
ncbi:16S rRNA (cytosine(1402)-N(4))-methyltransferase [Candidatus Uhrbacteria bacterium CG10_big_fil_rev_8_21_14_0_10_48_11]|uniref:Ribosomal RNA small subunit methyltransferase H n=1 Tax=Candidatus Uhrbacteria bacterium CG10_big_fil_rev_8_21_14_0_10_48_11 TaxID=1975037 RepID=A0A2M8LDF0_9BACT|nr:MAG: 16S rRNA (cytosine(1402)-N(4))-methyltransferase [Candidatus Uhrbacteria bacterium CG10_big_fil_rev_8_21_14_0_10_48_11]